MTTTVQEQRKPPYVSNASKNSLTNNSRQRKSNVQISDVLKGQKIQIEVPSLPPLGFRYDSEERPTIKRIKKVTNINGDILEQKDA